MTPRMRQEIDQILHDSDENDQIRPNPDHLTPEQTAAKADATRDEWTKRYTRNHLGRDFERNALAAFEPTPPAPYVPRNRVDPVRVACYVGCALLLGVVWAQIARWAL